MTPATSPSAAGVPASIDAVIRSSAWSKSVEVPSKENGMISKHDVLSDVR